MDIDEIVEFLDNHRQIFSEAIINHIEYYIDSKQKEQSFT